MRFITLEIEIDFQKLQAKSEDGRDILGFVRPWLLILLTGCQLVWDPDSYRGGADVGIDAPREDVGDGDPDVGVEDAPTDVFDADTADVLLVRDAGERDAMRSCELMPTGGRFTLSADSHLRNTRLTYSGAGPAVRVDGPNVEISNVDIVLTNPDGWGIEVVADDTTISEVRVVTTVDATTGAFAHRRALHAHGTSSPIARLMVNRFVSKGMEGVALERVRDSSINGLRIDGPAGAGASNFGVGDAHAGLRISETENVTISDFAIAGGGSAHVAHAAWLLDNSELTLMDGYVSVTTSGRWALLVEGLTPSDPRNQIQNVDISQSHAGLDFDGTRDWLLNDVKVVRRSDCDAPDNAFAARNGSVEIVCADCVAGGPCTAAPALAIAGVTSTSDGSVGGATSIDLCFGEE